MSDSDPPRLVRYRTRGPSADDGRLRLALVDDEMLWCDLLSVALATRGIDVVGSFSDPVGALDSWPPDVDVALLDVDLGSDLTGFRLARSLRARFPGLPIVFLTSVADPWMVDETAATAMAGTSYVLKRGVGDLASLCQIIRDTAQGDIVIADEMLSAMHGEGPVPGLTPTQSRILRLMTMGHSNANIADALGLALKTVEANITRISRALGVNPQENVRVGCVTRYLAFAAQGSHRTVQR